MLFRTIIVLLMCLIASATGSTQETEVQPIDGIVVTAARSPQAFSDVARQVTVINSQEIEKMPATGIADILSNAMSIDIRNRGVFGVQADLSMRGSTFEQTIVLIDGLKVTDPQTGHHSLDLPISKNNIERIEILNGAGSRLYGPNAMGGVVNIITKKNQPRKAMAELSIGDFGLSELSAGINFSPIGNVSVSKQHSDGYAYNTDFDILKASISNSFELFSGNININAGYSDKEFGANKFYTGFYPEWENTETVFLMSSADFRTKAISITPKIYYRHHDDHFVLKRYDTTSYENKTKTDQYGVELQTTYSTSWSTFVFGGEIASEEMKSTGLGDHNRNKGGIFFESQINTIEGLNVVPGVMAYKYSDYDWNFFPGIDIGFKFLDDFKLFGSINKAFRVPTYTDLYTYSPSNHGDSTLKPERSVSYEAGLKWSDNKSLSFSTTFFHRKGTNIIDWQKHSDSLTNPWKVDNLADVNTSGFEFSIRFIPKNPTIKNIGINYSYIDSEKEIDNSYISKYALSHLRHLFQSSMMLNLGPDLSCNTKFKYAEQISGEEYNTVDSRLSWKLDYVNLFAEISNIFAYQYSETGLSQMPGRWFRLGFSIESSL